MGVLLSSWGNYFQVLHDGCSCDIYGCENIIVSFKNTSVNPVHNAPLGPSPPMPPPARADPPPPARSFPTRAFPPTVAYGQLPRGQHE